MDPIKPLPAVIPPAPLLIDKTDPPLRDIRTAVFIQDACYKHRFIRSRDASAIFERPERLRAVKLGLAAAIARLEEHEPTSKSELQNTAEEPDDLIVALERMKLATNTTSAVSIVHSNASVDILNNAAVKFVHGDVDGDTYLENLKAWTRDSVQKITAGESEIPVGLSQGDLYLCPESVEAIQGAIGTVCEAVDTVIRSTRPTEKIACQGTSAERAFVAIRPPGHHCGEDTPSGFCFMNNVVTGAAHAHLEHAINRIVILDIDLHHGNGTQSIVWQINEETYRRTLESEYSTPEDAHAQKPGLQIYYGSIHDIASYPCEDGKVDLVQAASVSIHGAHGQHIENIHIHPYTSDEHFWEVLYKNKYNRLLKKAEDFLDSTGGGGDDVVVFISCGFDACEHEYPSMSRHGRKVPTSFYHRFARDACTFAEQYARGRLVSVLEGGYSDRALTGGAMAHLAGLAGKSNAVDEGWWGVDNLIKLEKASKKRRGPRNSAPDSSEEWLERTLSIFTSLDAYSSQYPQSSSRPFLPPSSMTLRERRKPPSSADSSPSTMRSKGEGSAKARNIKRPGDVAPSGLVGAIEESGSGATEGSGTESVQEVPKKLPRVILRVGPPPTSGP